jgi:hypothetical protein
MTKANKILKESTKYESLIKNSFWKNIRTLITGTKPAPPPGMAPRRSPLPPGATPEITPTGTLKHPNAWEHIPEKGYVLKSGWEWDAVSGKPVIKTISRTLPEGFSPEASGKLGSLTPIEMLKLIDPDTSLITLDITDLNNLPNAWKDPMTGRLALDANELALLRKEIAKQNSNIIKRQRELRSQQRGVVRSEVWTEVKNSRSAQAVAGMGVLALAAGVYYLFTGEDAPTVDAEKSEIIENLVIKESINSAPKPNQIIANLNKLSKFLNSALIKVEDPKNITIINNFIRSTKKMSAAMTDFSKSTLNLDSKSSVETYIVKLNLLEKHITDFNDSLVEMQDLAAQAKNMQMLSVIDELDSAFSQYSDIIVSFKSMSSMTATKKE